MKVTRIKNREVLYLVVVLIVAGGFVAINIAINFTDMIYDFFKAYTRLAVREFSVNLIFLGVTLLLWLTYRRWKEADRRKEELENIIDSISPDVFVVINSDRTIVMCNSSVKRMFGYEMDEVINQKADLLYFAEQSSSEHWHEIFDTLEREGFHIGLAAGKKKNGKTIPLEIITGNLSGHAGAVLLLHDITERTEMQERLLRQEKLAVLGQLAGGMGHELRNPLGVIGNSAYYLNMKLKDADEKVKKHLDILQGEVQRANKIISDLLEFSKARPPSLVEYDLNSIIIDALAEIKIPENISVESQLDKKLPRIQLDPDQIRRVFINIISDAVQAMPEGGRLDINTGVKGDFVEMMIRDTGEGIPEENIQKIFEPLFSTRARGIGLGLTIVKGIIDSHKGVIEVESGIGEGTTFTIKLPLEEEKERGE